MVEYNVAGMVRIIGSDTPVTQHSVNAQAGLVLLSLPEVELGQPLMELEEGTPLEVIGFSRTYLLVRAQGLEGYVKGQGLTTYETRCLPEVDPPAYEILVNKSNFMVSVYRLDENGQRVGEPIRSEIAALGKRSTPTPSGRYALGFKQRWVRFTHAQALAGDHLTSRRSGQSVWRICIRAYAGSSWGCPRNCWWPTAWHC